MNKLYSGIFLTVFSFQAWCMENPPRNTLYDLVLREHTPALDTRELPIPTLATATNDESRELAQVSSKQMALSEKDRFKRVTELFQQRGSGSTRAAICPKTIQKLELLAGKNSDSRGDCLLSRFPTYTTAGKVLLAKRLISLYTSSEISQFQALIRAFDQPEISVFQALIRTSNQRENRENIRRQLEIVSRSEQALLSLWTSNFNCVDLIGKYVQQRTPTIPLYGSVGAENIGLVNATSNDFNNQAGWSDSFVRWLLNCFTEEGAKSDAFIHTLQTLLRQKTDALFAFCDATRSIAGELRRSNTPKEKIALDNFFISNTTRNLLALKRQLRETEDPITQIGLYFQATSLLYAMKPDLLTTYKTLGKLDQLACLAHVKHTSPNPFCFAQFTGESTASLRLDDYWNPMLSGNVVKNSIRVGPHEPHVIIVGGINGTGKTTAIRAIGLCKHLAGTTGVVPARECHTSKPAHVFTSMHEQDNLASRGQGGASLFQAQAQALADILKQVRDNPGLSIVVIDEPCTATSPANAKLAVGEFFRQLTPMQQKVICLMTTHFEEIRAFAQENPRAYRLMFGHEDFRVTDDGVGALDYQGVTERVLAMFRGQ